MTRRIPDDGADGLSAYALARKAGFKGQLPEWLASLKGKDGTCVTVEDVRPVLREMVDAIPPAKDGTSVTVEDVRPLLREMVDALPPAKDGVSVTPEQLRPMLTAMVKALPPAVPGLPGEDGFNGWTPLLALADDGERRVMQIHDWIGGTGPKPETGFYLGRNGLVTRMEEATDLRGPAGASGAVRFAGGGGLSEARVIQLINEHCDGGVPNVRFVSTDTAITEADDILVVTAGVILTLPTAVGSVKYFKIKRSCPDDITVQGVFGQTVEGEAFRVINVNLYALELKSDGANWIEL